MFDFEFVIVLGDVWAPDLPGKLTNTFQNIMMALMRQKLIYIALQATWKLQICHPGSGEPRAPMVWGQKIPSSGADPPGGC